MPELAGDLELTISSVVNRYVVKRSPNGELEYRETDVNSNQESVPDILPVSAEWPLGSPNGFGETLRLSRDSAGYMYSTNIDTSMVGIWRPRGKKVTSASPSNALTNVPTFMFLAQETGGSAKFIYVLNGQYVYKLSTDGSTLTIQNEDDFDVESGGSGCKAGHPAQLAGTWYVPLGTGGDMVKLSNISSGAAADTWDVVNAGVKADHLTVAAVGATSVLVRAVDDDVSISTDSGLNFGGDFPTGSGTAIENIQAGASGIYVGKRDNLGRLVGGLWQQLTRFNEGDDDDDFGSGMLVPGGSDACFYNHRGMHFFDGAGVQDITPGQLTAQYHAGVTTIGPPSSFTFYETAYASEDWLYFIATAVGGPGGHWILAHNRRSNTWHTYAHDSGVTKRGLITDTDKHLFTCDITNNTFIHYDIGSNGQPYTAKTTAAESGFSGAQLILPSDDFGHPGTLKQLRSMEAYMEDLDATNTIIFGRARDGGSFTSFGSAFSSDGFQQAYATPTAETFYRIAPGAQWTCDGTEDTKIVGGLIVRATLRPESLRRIDFTITTNDDYADGSEQVLDGQTILSNWRSVNRGAPQTFRDPEGTSKSIVVTNVEATPIQVDSNEIHYEVSVTAYVWTTS